MKKPEDISDAEATQALADPAQRAEIVAFLAAHNASLPPEQLPSDVLKAALADIHNHKAQLQAKAEAVTDEMVARALQNDEMRQALEGFLKANSYDGVLDQAPVEMIKSGIATVIGHAQGEQAELQQKASSTIAPDQIPDEMLDAALANDRMREALGVALKTLGNEQPLDEAPRELVKAAFAAMASMAQQRQQQHRQISDEAVAAVFADSRANDLLREVMSQNNLEGEPQDLPDEIKRKIVEVLVEKGAVRFGDDQAP